jgi:hypothetical protein
MKKQEKTMTENKLDFPDDFYHKLGEEILDLLNSHSNRLPMKEGRIKTKYGSKTPAGLARTMENLIHEAYMKELQNKHTLT